MADPIYPGQRVLVEIKFYLLGVPADPTIARCLIRDPSGSQTVLTYPASNFTRRDLGFFEANIVLNSAGPWNFRGEGAGVVDAVQETMLSVADSVFT
jgi:hypothetical protein